MGLVKTVSHLLAREVAAPRSALAPFLFRWMALRTRRENARAVEMLALAPEHAVLELGFGHGAGVARLAKRVPKGLVGGVDPSPRMLRFAARRNRRAIAAGRVDLRLGSAAALPFQDARFDCAVSAHTLYFWPDVEAGLREIRRVLRPGGRLVLVFLAADESPSPRLHPPEIFRFLHRREVARALGAAGFRYVEIDRPEGRCERVSFARAERADRRSPSSSDARPLPPRRAPEAGPRAQPAPDAMSASART